MGFLLLRNTAYADSVTLRFRPEWGNHNSAWGNAPGGKSKNTPSPNGAAQIYDKRTIEIISTVCSALSGLNHSCRSASQGVALG
jgi:hypothetical protein